MRERPWIRLSKQEQRELRRWLQSGLQPVRTVLRALVLRQLAEGQPIRQVAKNVGLTPKTVWLTSQRMTFRSSQSDGRSAHSGKGHIDPSPRVVTGVSDRKPVTGKRAGGWRLQVKERVDGPVNTSGEAKRSEAQSKDHRSY